MKKIVFMFLSLLVIPLGVLATSMNTKVSNNLTYEDCINFQDENLTTNGFVYFGVCRMAKCENNKWKLFAYGNNEFVSCRNGNKNMYTKTINSGCYSYNGTCTSGSKYYCSEVVFYDCSKNSDGSSFTTTTTTTTTATTKKKTTSTTTKKKTTTTTTTKKKNNDVDKTTTTTTTTQDEKTDSNNYLSKLNLSIGNIDFNKYTNEYTINVNKDVKKIDIEAIPESNTSTIEILNDDSFDESTPIIIRVTAEDGSINEYIINTKYEEDPKVGSTRIDQFEIKGYKIKFNPNVNNYDLKINKKTTKLDFDIRTEDPNAKVEVYGNDNLENKSVIQVVVKNNKDNEEVSNVYTLNIKKSSNFILIIIVIIIILVLIYFGIKLIINLIPRKKDDGYDYE